MKIDWELFPIKLHYLVRFSGTGPLTPFLPVIARHKGVSEQVISLIWTVLPFISLVSKTVAGAMADYFRIHRQIFLFGLLLMMGSFIGVYFTPNIMPNSPNVTEGALELLGNSTDQVGEPTNTTTTLLPTGELLKRYEFWILFICLLGQYCGHITTITMQETVCFSILGDNRHKYGMQRLWGTIGWGVSAVAGGALVDWYSKGTIQPDYAPAFLMAVVFLTLDLAIVARLKFSITPVKMDPKAVKGIFKIPTVILILVSVLIIGTSCGMLWTFELLLVEDIAKAWQSDFPYAKLLQGLIIFVQCILSEAPSFFIAGYIIKKIGHCYSIFVAIIAFSVRLCLYAAVTNPWWFLLIEMSHGMSFGLGYASMASYANSITPKGAEATTQAIFGATFFGSTGIGGLLGGWLFRIMTGKNAFLTMGIVDGIYAIIFLVSYLLISRTGGEQRIRGRKDGKFDERAADEEMEKFREANSPS